MTSQAHSQNNLMEYQKYFKKGKEALEEEDYTLALENFEKALSLDPESSEVYLERAYAYQKLGNYEEAQKDLNWISSSETPNNEKLFNRQGLLFLDRNEFKKAKSEFDLAIEINPSEDSYYYNRALAHSFLDNHSSALEDLNEAASLNHEGANIYYLRSQINESLNKHSESLADCIKTLILDRTNEDAENHKKYLIGTAIPNLVKEEDRSTGGFISNLIIFVFFILTLAMCSA